MVPIQCPREHNKPKFRKSKHSKIKYGCWKIISSRKFAGDTEGRIGTLNSSHLLENLSQSEGEIYYRHVIYL